LGPSLNKGSQTPAFGTLQLCGRTASQDHNSRLLLDRDPDHLAQPQDRCGQAEDPEVGSRYLFICLYLWLEKHLSRGDYKRKDA
jgi:hypothetical protein